MVNYIHIRLYRQNIKVGNADLNSMQIIFVTDEED